MSDKTDAFNDAYEGGTTLYHMENNLAAVAIDTYIAGMDSQPSLEMKMAIDDAVQEFIENASEKHFGLRDGELDTKLTLLEAQNYANAVTEQINSADFRKNLAPLVTRALSVSENNHLSGDYAHNDL